MEFTREEVKDLFWFNKKLILEDIGTINPKEDNILINFEGNTLKLKNKIYICRNRYYIPFSEIISVNGGVIKEKGSNIKLNFQDEEFNLNTSNNTWINKKFKREVNKLKKPLLKDGETIYISLVDFGNILNLKSRWNSENKCIKLYKDIDHKEVVPYVRNSKQKGLLRLEDVAIGGSGTKYDSNYLECTRYMGAFLGKRGVPYHVAWIPRYIDSKKNIDGDPSKKNSFPLAELIYTLDYLSFRRGIIGLHGYTHQRGDEESGIGNEFGADYPSIDELKERIEKALDIAKYLDVKIEFFEAPHYVITFEQNKVLQNYFKYIINNYKSEEHLSNQIDIVKANDYKEAYYIPTPLYYVDDRTGDNMVRVIENMDNFIFAGLFYHPIVEHTLVEFKEREDGYPVMEYKFESTLKKVIKALEGRGVNMIEVSEI